MYKTIDGTQITFIQSPDGPDNCRKALGRPAQACAFPNYDRRACVVVLPDQGITEDMVNHEIDHCLTRDGGIGEAWGVHNHAPDHGARTFLQEFMRRGQ